MRKRILTVVAISGLMSGCRIAPQPTATLAPTLTSAPSKPAPAATSRPTVTPVPPTPTLTVTPTPIPPTLTPTASPTPFLKSRADWTSYTNSNNVTGVAFDGDGYLWATSGGDGYSWATSGGGVVRWNLADGTHVKYTSEDGLPDHTVTSVAMAPDGTLWFGTLNGVVHFDREAASGGGDLDEAWTTYAWADGLPGYWITSVAVAPDGTVWAGTLRGGVARYDGTTWTAYDTDDGLVSNDVRAIAITSDGEVWFGTCALWGSASNEPPPCFGVSRLGGVGTPGETWTTYNEEDGLGNNRVNAIAVGPDGALWFGTGPLEYYPWDESPGSGGVSRFDPSAGPGHGGETWTTYTVEDGLADNWVNSIAVAPNGALWFGTAGGLSRFDGAAWQTYTVADGLADNRVKSLDVAPDGTICAGTGGGVSCFDGAVWTTYVTDGPVANNVPAIAVALDGTVWAGSGEAESSPASLGRGISRFDGESWTAYTTDDGLADNTIVSIAVATNGAVWVATGDPDEEPTGVSRFDPSAGSGLGGEAWTTYTTADGLASDDVRSIAVGPDGVVWFASRDGLTKLDGESWKAYDVAALHVAVGDSTVWIGDDSGGVSRFVRGKSYSVSGLASDKVRCMAAGPDGTVWVGASDAGVSRFDGQSWTTYTTDDGVVSHLITDIAMAPDGVVWVATSSGISRFDPSAGSGHGGTAWVSFTKADGLASNYVHSVAVGPDGVVWFGTRDGISRYLPID